MDTNLGRVIGYDGKQIELSRDSLYIKWRYVGDAVWKNLIALNDLKVGLPKGGKTDQVLAKLSNNDWDYVWKTPESGGGSIDTVQLASVTTAPVAPFPVNTKYYNANDNIIYRATEENTWENADTEEPILGAFYIYDDEIYFYDKKSQSLYMVKTIPSTIFYANKIMEAGESNINMEVDLSNSLILSVHVNGHFQTHGKNYTISTENEESTIYFDESVDEDSEVDVVYSSYMELSDGGGISDYSQLTNKPKINNVELKGNKTSDNLGLQNKITTDNKLSVNLVSGLAPIATSGSYNDLSNKPTIDNTLNDNSENAVQNKVIKAAIDGKATSSTTLSGYGITDAYTKTEVDTSLSNKQDTLVSGTNIKTINNESILGSGNIEIQGGGSSATLNFFDNVSGTTLDTQLTLGNAVLVFKNGNGPLRPTHDYTISGSVITFVTPLDASQDTIGVLNGNLASIDLTNYVTKTQAVLITDELPRASQDLVGYTYMEQGNEDQIDIYKCVSYSSPIYQVSVTFNGNITITGDDFIAFLENIMEYQEQLESITHGTLTCSDYDEDEEENVWSIVCYDDEDNKVVNDEGFSQSGLENYGFTFEGEFEVGNTVDFTCSIQQTGSEQRYQWKTVSAVSSATLPDIEEIEDIDVVLDIIPNTIYKCLEPIDSLELIGSDDDYENCIIYFTTNSSTPSFTDSIGLHWKGGVTPTLNSNTIYRITITVNGLAEIDNFGTADE